MTINSETKTLRTRRDSYCCVTSCDYCDRPRIDKSRGQQATYDHVRTEEEHFEEVASIAAARDLNLDKAGDRQVAIHEVGWEPGSVNREIAFLCSRCSTKVRTCSTCDFLGQHTLTRHEADPLSEEGRTIFKCHFDHMTYTRGDNIDHPHLHFCSDWSQAEPFNEQWLLETLDDHDENGEKP